MPEKIAIENAVYMNDKTGLFPYTSSYRCSELRKKRGSSLSGNKCAKCSSYLESKNHWIIFNDELHVSVQFCDRLMCLLDAEKRMESLVRAFARSIGIHKSKRESHPGTIWMRTTWEKSKRIPISGYKFKITHIPSPSSCTICGLRKKGCVRLGMGSDLSYYPNKGCIVCRRCLSTIKTTLGDIEINAKEWSLDVTNVLK